MLLPIEIRLSPPPTFRGQRQHWRYFEIDLLYPLARAFGERYPGARIDRQIAIGEGLVPDLVVYTEAERVVVEVKKGAAGVRAYRQLLAYVSWLAIDGVGPVRGVLAAERFDNVQSFAAAPWLDLQLLVVVVEGR